MGEHGLDSYGLQSRRERGLDPGEKITSGPLARAAQLKIFTLNRKDRLSVAE